MAVAFNASGDDLRRTTGLPASSAFSVCGWARRNADTNNWTQLFSLCDSVASASAEINFQYDSAGDVLGCYTGSFSSLSITPGSTPFFWFLSVAGTGSGQVTFGARLLSANSLTSSTTSGAGFTPGAMFFGNNSYGEYFDGRLWNLKVWDRALSLNEMLGESFYFRPIYPTSLHLWLPLPNSGDTNDRSGNGKNPTVTGTLTTEDNLFQPWRPRIRGSIKTASSSITGTLSKTLAAVTSSGSGSVNVDGTAAITLANVTSSGAGAVNVDGSTAVTLGALTSTGSGAVNVDGSLAQTLGDVTCVAAGNVATDITGTLSQTLANVTSSGSGTVDVAGTLAQTLAAVTGAGAGIVTIDGTLAQTLGAVTSSAAGAVTIEGSAAVTLGDVTCVAVGSVVSGVAGTLEKTLDAVTAAGSGSVTIDGSLSITLGTLTSSGAGAVTIEGSANITLGALTLSAYDTAPATTTRGGGYPFEHRGSSKKRATLKLNKERAAVRELRSIYRALTSSPATKERAEAIIALPVTKLDDESVAQFERREADRRAQLRASRIRELSNEKEISLRMLYAELALLEQMEDELAIAEILSIIL